MKRFILRMYFILNEYQNYEKQYFSMILSLILVALTIYKSYDL